VGKIGNAHKIRSNSEGKSLLGIFRHVLGDNIKMDLKDFGVYRYLHTDFTRQVVLSPKKFFTKTVYAFLLSFKRLN
jgi:hypothetical protein